MSMKRRHAILTLFLGAVCSTSAQAARQPVKAPAVVALDPGLVSDSNQSEVEPGAKGASVLRAQILLARAHFSCGEIDGSFGSNLKKALAAFQAERKLPVSGKIDAATWAA